MIQLSRGITNNLISDNLADLLHQARQNLEKQGHQHTTQRGTTYSSNGVALTWLPPHILGETDLTWSQPDVNWYLRSFVNRNKLTDPLNSDSGLLFPYTYAARARFWDGGWSHLNTLVSNFIKGQFTIDKAVKSKDHFIEMVAALSEQLHVQLVLSTLALYPPTLFRRFLLEPDVIYATALSWRRDILGEAIADIKNNPHSRRAVVSSFSYPQLEGSLHPQMGKPPYQLFQFLPEDATAPVDSIHEHRSLDIIGGAQLDFAHDFSWLSYACKKLGRPIGSITIIAHNLHEYHDLKLETAVESGFGQREIERWLCRVTDGYKRGSGTPAILLGQRPYLINLERIYALWTSHF